VLTAGITIYDIGLLSAGSKTAPYTQRLTSAMRGELAQLHRLGAFRFRLQPTHELYADYNDAQLPALAQSLVQAGLDAIIAGSTPAALALVNASQALVANIPIVVMITGDRNQFLGSPVAGILDHGQGQAEDQVAFLADEVSANGGTLATVAVLRNANNPGKSLEYQNTLSAIANRGLQPYSMDASVLAGMTDLQAAQRLTQDFRAAKAAGAGGGVVIEDPLVMRYLKQIIDTVDSSDPTVGMPAIYGPPEIVDNPTPGLTPGLMAYGPRHENMWAGGVYLLYKILVLHQNPATLFQQAWPLEFRHRP
jgi:hypothetical protein